VSYWHMVGVAASYGETGIIPYLLPVSVDGMIVVATITLVEISAKIRHLETTTETTPEPVDTSTVDYDQETDTNPVSPSVTSPATTPPAVPALLPKARLIANAHQQATGTPITPADLAGRMGIATDTAAALLAAVNPASTPAPVRINGTAVQEALL